MQTETKLCMENLKCVLDQVTKKWSTETPYLYSSQARIGMGKKVSLVAINSTPAVLETNVKQ